MRAAYLRLPLAVIVVVSGLVPRAHAQYDAARAEALARAVTERSVHTSIFGSHLTGDSAASLLQASLQTEIDDWHAACALDAPQREKLHLAGQGDIQRYLTSLAVLVDDSAARDSSATKVNLSARIQALRTQYADGLFAEGSLFTKTAARSLSRTQLERYEAHQKERRAFHHRARIELGVASIGQTLGLNDTQRQQLRTLLADVEPLRHPGPHDTYILVYQMSQLPEEKLRPVFSPTQWRGVEQIFVSVRNRRIIFLNNGSDIFDLYVNRPRETGPTASPSAEK